MWDDGVIYDEWSGGNCGDGLGPLGNDTSTCYGMRYPETVQNGNKHGIVRTEWFNGTIEEGTWYSANEGDPATKWGFTRLIDDGRVFLQFWKDGSVHFQSTFDGNFVELDRIYEEKFRDEFFMQEIAPFKFAKDRIDDKVMLERVLDSRPVHMSPSQDALWSRFINIDLAFYETWWDVSKEKKIVWEEVEYDEWTSLDTIAFNQVVVRNYGTRVKGKGTRQEAGLVRQVAFGDFRQLTFNMEGRKNGISLGVAGADVHEPGK